VNALGVEGLIKDFGGLRAVDHITLSVAPGERLAILGPNGAGKTTFFNIVTGLLAPSSGRITLLGHDVTRLPTHRHGTSFALTSKPKMRAGRRSRPLFVPSVGK